MVAESDQANNIGLGLEEKLFANIKQSYGVYSVLVLLSLWWRISWSNSTRLCFHRRPHIWRGNDCGPLVTVLTKLTSMKVPVASGATMLRGAFIAASCASQIWHLYLSQGVLVGIGVGCLYAPSLPVLSQWFTRRRSLANGISAAGSGTSGLVFSFAIGAMIDNLSLAWSLRIIGVITLFMNTLAAAFIRDRNADIQLKQRPFDRELLCRAEVWLLLAWSFISMLGYITLLYSLSDFALSIGLSRDRATQIIAILNAGTAIGYWRCKRQIWAL